jgi:hypothetical protein
MSRGIREAFGWQRVRLLMLALLKLAGGADPWLAAPLELTMRRADIRAAAAVHADAAPSSRAGRWVRADASTDWLTTGHSPQHLVCLDTERQGNCYNDSANMQAADEAKRSRHHFMAQGAAIRNGADVLAGRNEWAWRAADTNRSAQGLYEPLSMSRGEFEVRFRAFLDEGSRFHVIGDSVSRQFAKSLECMIRHKLDVDNKAAVVVYQLLDSMWGSEPKKLRRYLSAVRKRDVVVLNAGLHVDPAKGKGFRHGDPPRWLSLYALAVQHLFEALAEFALDASRVFVRTTTVRFVSRDAGGDWDGGEPVVCGGTAPDPRAAWSSFGGWYPSQPRQNQMLLTALDATPWQLLDVAPLTLSRAGAVFDCTHLCLPGPMEVWSSLLLNRVVGEALLPAAEPAGRANQRDVT